MKKLILPSLNKNFSKDELFPKHILGEKRNFPSYRVKELYVLPTVIPCDLSVVTVVPFSINSILKKCSHFIFVPHLFKEFT